MEVRSHTQVLKILGVGQEGQVSERLLLEENDPGKDFKKIGDEEDDTEGFEVIEPSAGDGVAPTFKKKGGGGSGV